MSKLYSTRDTVTGLQITMPYYVEWAKSSRVPCTKCHDDIQKGTLKIGVMPPGIDTLVWRHLDCVTHRHATNVFNYYNGDFDKMEGRENITDDDWGKVEKTYLDALTRYDSRAKKGFIPPMRGSTRTKKMATTESKKKTPKRKKSEKKKTTKKVAPKKQKLERKEETTGYKVVVEHIQKAGTSGPGKRSNPWMLHVAEYMKENKCTMKQALIGAKKTYTKMKHEPGLPIKPLPLHLSSLEALPSKRPSRSPAAA